MPSHSSKHALLARIEEGTVVLGVVGLGYVGLPLAVEAGRAGFRALGFDLAPKVVEGVTAGTSHVRDVPAEVVSARVRAGLLSATSDVERLVECDAISICVPTPLNKIKDPDLSFLVDATRAAARSLRPGQVVILESTSYPGTTREIVLPLLEESGLEVGTDFFLCYSPERVDPGNPVWHIRNTPKVLGGVTDACAEVGLRLYERIFDSMVPVESVEAAELTKVYENTFRMINIGLANELAQACDRLGVDVWGVIEAASTKPFGFMKFTPGPGLGGHCIPLDPHYLSWKMRTLAYRTRMIDLASEINSEMPGFVVQKVAKALNDEGKPVRRARILLLGFAYKRETDDVRESPAVEILRLLSELGAEVSYHDPYCPVLPAEAHPTDPGDAPLTSVGLTPRALRESDLVVVVTDHEAVDYSLVAQHARLVVDTRGVMRKLPGPVRVVGLAGGGATGN